MFIEQVAAPPPILRRKAARLSYRSIGPLVAAIDYVSICAACFAAGYGYELLIRHQIASFAPYFAIANISALLFVILSRQLYRSSAFVSLSYQLRGAVLNWMVLLLIFLFMLFLLKISANLSRGALTIFGVLGLTTLLTSRFFIVRALQASLADGSLVGYPSVVIGDSESLKKVSKIEVLRRFGASELRRFQVATGRGIDPRIIEEAISFARERAEWILLALPWGSEDVLKSVCGRLQVLPLPVLLLPDFNIRSIISKPALKIGADFIFEIQRAPLSPAELTLKRMIDWAFSSTCLVLLAPLLATVALAIKLESPGPVIFCQRRRGFNGREFTVYKFRTMTVLEDGAVILQTKRKDARVTRLGRVLRATSIDELPQLINVLRGQMSLVGPRPHALAHDDGYAKQISNYAFRQHVKPGLTGWAQVNGLRGETSRLELMEQRVAHDLWYIENWSIWLDLRIIVLTMFELLRPKNAY
jgi:undecaprenyl-phosphate galactose phosphotransferase/putative colanic acid biosynthesis UDP-glucose lipid carrier transferase